MNIRLVPFVVTLAGALVAAACTVSLGHHGAVHRRPVRGRPGGEAEPDR